MYNLYIICILIAEIYVIAISGKSFFPIIAQTRQKLVRNLSETCQKTCQKLVRHYISLKKEAFEEDDL
jgi:hypothetical protein